jgi:hypothetical protein
MHAGQIGRILSASHSSLGGTVLIDMMPFSAQVMVYCQVVDRIEAIMHIKAFNQLGGLLLDRNVRALVATLSDVTQKTVLLPTSTLNFQGVWCYMIGRHPLLALTWWPLLIQGLSIIRLNYLFLFADFLGKRPFLVLSYRNSFQAEGTP